MYDNLWFGQPSILFLMDWTRAPVWLAFACLGMPTCCYGVMESKNLTHVKVPDHCTHLNMILYH